MRNVKQIKHHPKYNGNENAILVQNLAQIATVASNKLGSQATLDFLTQVIQKAVDEKRQMKKAK
jgi:hypothetical protein